MTTTTESILSNAKLRKTDTLVSVLDIIKYFGVKNPRDSLSHFCSKYPDMNFTAHKFPGRGQNYTPCVEKSQLEPLVCKLLIQSRLPLSQKKSILPHVDDSAFIRSYAESEWIDRIRRATKRYVSATQFPVGKSYRVDLCYPKYRLLVECDEYGHKSYNASEERTRTEALESYAGQRIIRFDPYDKKCCIFDVISQIYGHLTDTNVTRS